MNIYIYSDESGVFDKEHNKLFVFAGVIILGSTSNEIWSRKYSAAEKVIRENKCVGKKYELKATNLTNKEKSNLFRSLNNCYKFAVIVRQNAVQNQIFKSKKDKQRYLDYVYKIAVKRALEEMIENDIIHESDIERIYFYVDEHTTATNGRYELQESLEQEFRFGTYNFNYSKYFPPIFHNILQIKVEYCNSENKLLVRADDIIANRVYYLALQNDRKSLNNIKNLHLIYQP